MIRLRQILPAYENPLAGIEGASVASSSDHLTRAGVPDNQSVAFILAFSQPNPPALASRLDGTNRLPHRSTSQGVIWSSAITPKARTNSRMPCNSTKSAR